MWPAGPSCRPRAYFLLYSSTTSGFSFVTSLHVCTVTMLQVSVVDRIVTLHLSCLCNTMAFPTRYSLTRPLATSRFPEHLIACGIPRLLVWTVPVKARPRCSSYTTNLGDVCVEVVSKYEVAQTFIRLDKWMAQVQVLEQQQNLSRDMTDLQKEC